MDKARNWSKFLSGVFFAEMVLMLLLWIAGERLTLWGLSVGPGRTMYAFLVSFLVFVILTSYAFFGARRDMIE